MMTEANIKDNKDSTQRSGWKLEQNQNSERNSQNLSLSKKSLYIDSLNEITQILETTSCNYMVIMGLTKWKMSLHQQIS